MKKIVFLTIILFILTGCSTEYNVEFKNGKFKDNVKIGEFNKEEISDYAYIEPVASYKDYDTQYYEMFYKDNYLNLTHEYSYNEYRVSTVLIDCFDVSGIFYDDDYYYISTSGEFKCMSYIGYKNENVKVNFFTDLKVESSNADAIIDDVYTWNFNDDNYRDKTIDIKLVRNSAKESNSETDNRKKTILSNGTIAYFLIVIPLMILLYILYRRFKKYSDSKNKMPD